MSILDKDIFKDLHFLRVCYKIGDFTIVKISWNFEIQKINKVFYIINSK